MADSSDSGSDSNGSPVVQHVQMVKLTKIYQKNGDLYTEWNGKKPGPNTVIFVTVILNNECVKGIVFSNCGDLIRKEHYSYQIQDWPLQFTIQGPASHPIGVGSFLKLPNSSSTLGQPRFIRDCWHDVTFLLQNFMRQGKIFKFDPISGIERSSNRHTSVEKPDDYTFFLNISSIPCTETCPYTPPVFSSNPIFTNPTIDIPESVFKNPELYTPFYNYIPRHITGSIMASESGGPQELGRYVGVSVIPPNKKRRTRSASPPPPRAPTSACSTTR
jgi:hypothetical protein